MEAILDATAQVLVEEGYDAASTNRIAKRAGVSIGSLYQYFPSKDALLLALLERHSDEMVALLAQTLVEMREAPLEVAVKSFIQAMLRAHAVDPELHRVLTEQVPQKSGLDRLLAVNERAAAFAKAYLAERRAELRDVDLDVAVFVLTLSVEAVTHAAVLRRPGLLGDDALADELTELVLRYLRR